MVTTGQDNGGWILVFVCEEPSFHSLLRDEETCSPSVYQARASSTSTSDHKHICFQESALLTGSKRTIVGFKALILVLNMVLLVVKKIFNNKILGKDQLSKPEAGF